MKALEEIRKTPNLFIDAEAENDGMGGRYYDKQTGKFLHFIFSYQMGWEHLSVSTPSKCPTWEQMCMMKDIFWNKDECCVEYHPKEEDYVNNHPYCLHIWRPTEEVIPTPPTLLVGFRNETEKNAFLIMADKMGVKVNPWKFKKEK
jgi:hypothetical protein